MDFASGCRQKAAAPLLIDDVERDEKSSRVPSSFSFPKSARLATRTLFQQISRKGSKRVGRYILVDFRANGFASSRLGITCSRKYGCAVERNRFKRMVRHAFRTSEIPKGFDFNVRPRSLAKGASAVTIQKELLQLCLNLIDS